MVLLSESLHTPVPLAGPHLPGFWKLSDSFNDYYEQHTPIEAGIFDLNRYENR